jgi:hypothetical protein
VKFPLRSINDNFECAFVGVYGRNNDNDKKVLWDGLPWIMSWWEMPWRHGVLGRF